MHGPLDPALGSAADQPSMNKFELNLEGHPEALSDTIQMNPTPTTTIFPFLKGSTDLMPHMSGTQLDFINSVLHTAIFPFRFCEIMTQKHLKQLSRP